MRRPRKYPVPVCSDEVTGIVRQEHKAVERLISSVISSRILLHGLLHSQDVMVDFGDGTASTTYRYPQSDRRCVRARHTGGGSFRKHVTGGSASSPASRHDNAARPSVLPHDKLVEEHIRSICSRAAFHTKQAQPTSSRGLCTGLFHFFMSH